MLERTPEDLSKLISRVAMRDRAAFDALYRATSAKLFGVCLRVLKDRGEAEDALQDIYVKIWNRADRFAITDSSPISWLVAIARNHAIDLLRARRPVGDLETAGEIAEPSPGPERNAVAASEARQIDRCLGELDPPRADAVRGAYMNGETYEELAKRHGVPLNTMRTWLRRSLIKLRECLQR
ncbi:RNA polymerase subunit sigma [Phyllobacterium phragmitis]|uniref:RNA polymerase subunit sigma n=2 Tax=Phyllobacterium phragmitis TaxID=2670329 RepID=A0A2S9IRW8_9HYPH|nr:RNA polymerase subunit sigma [Phyllobacterium phragmitis]